MNSTTVKLARLFTVFPTTPGANATQLAEYVLATLTTVPELELTFDPTPRVGRTGTLTVRVDGETGTVPGVFGSVFRAVLARVSVLLTKDRTAAASVSGGTGEIRVRVTETEARVRVEFSNTPDRQHLGLTRVAITPPAAKNPTAVVPNGTSSHINPIEILAPIP